MYYTDAHRMFMQVLSSVRKMDETDAKELLQKCFEEIGAKAQTLEDFVTTLNKELQYMELSVLTTTEERGDGDHPCLVLINLMSGEITQTLSSFSKQELSFIQKLVLEIMDSDIGEVKSNFAINIGLSVSPKLNPRASEDLLQRLIRDNWLILIENEGCEYVSLSGLATAELAPYLEVAYADDVPKCFFCTKITLKGHHCGQCSTSIHRDCAKKYWTNRGGGNVCPGEGCNASLLSRQEKRKRAECNGEEDSMDEEEPETQEHEERRRSGRNRMTRGDE